VLPLLAEAAQALEKIKPEDITTMKSFVTPPPVLDDVMKGVILTLGLEKDVKWKPKEPGSMEKV
jgi:dynein heavy chain